LVMAILVLGRIPIGIILSIINRRRLYELMQYYGKREDELFRIGLRHEKNVDRLRATGSYDNVVESCRESKIVLKNYLMSFASALASSQYWFVLAVMPNITLFGNRRKAPT
jgi:hypothetical protein